MFFPEQLLRLSARDLEVTWLDPVVQRVTSSVAATGITVVFPVPINQFLLLQTCGLQAQPGAGQTSNQRRIVLRRPPDTTEYSLWLEHEIGAAAQLLQDTWAGSILVPAGWEIAGVGQFSAGAVANAITLSVFGMFIPIANVQRI